MGDPTTLCTASSIALASSGLFLVAGMATGAWKWQQMMHRPSHQANAYVDIAHRAALLYSFACLVMMKLAEFSPYPGPVQVGSVLVPLLFFYAALGSYLWHGYRNREQTQFSESNWVTTRFMVVLIVGEIGGVAILVWGFLSHLVVG